MRTGAARHRECGFTCVELAAVVLMLLILGAALMVAGRGSRLADGLTQSTANVRQLLIAAVRYRWDHAGAMPMRGCGYSNGQIVGGWDAWNFAGKNCDAFWQGTSGGIFDESGFARPLNTYLYPARIPQPPGYFSSGSGSTWSFNHGHPTAAQRAALQVDVCRSPGDVATRQRNWPAPTPGISGYNDIGTSYLLNMRWWGQPGYPSNFTARYNEGLRRIGLAFDGANPSYVWIADQTADAVSSGGSTPGEFGKTNASVCGFADGTVRYLRLSPNLLSGPGYTFLP
jgi:hypothetical protein